MSHADDLDLDYGRELLSFLDRLDAESAAPLQQKGHSGEAYTYGQRRGPTPQTPEHLEIEMRDKPYQAQDEDETTCDDSDVKALHAAMAEDSEEETAEASESEDPEGELDTAYDDDTGEVGQIATNAHKGAGGHSVSSETFTDEADPVEAFGAASASSQERVNAELGEESQPAPSEPVSARSPFGMSKSKIQTPATEGQEILHK